VGGVYFWNDKTHKKTQNRKKSFFTDRRFYHDERQLTRDGYVSVGGQPTKGGRIFDEVKGRSAGEDMDCAARLGRAGGYGSPKLLSVEHPKKNWERGLFISP